MSRAFETCAVVTPPLYSPTYPQMGPTVIKGFLKRSGLDFDHFDLNIALRDHLRQKVRLEVLENPGGQVHPTAPLDLLAMRFADRCVDSLASRADPLGEAIARAGTIEQYNPEMGAGLGYGGVVTSSHALLAELVGDRARNYYHRFLDETRWDERLARYDLIGFSLIGASQLVFTLTLAHRLRRLAPRTRILLGGPWTTMFAAELAGAPKLAGLYDMIVEGEGELPMRLLLEATGDADLPSIPNLWRRGKTGFAAPASRYLADPAQASPPDLGGLDLDQYNAPRPVMVQGSRGCYWGRCAFCVHTAGVHGVGARRVRRRAAEEIAADFEHLAKTFNPGFVSFADVSIAPASMRRICERLVERGNALPWLAFIRFEPGFDRDLLGLMRRAGGLILHFGLESGSQRVLDLMDKGHDLGTAMRIIEDAVDLGFRVTVHTMAGLPGEAREDLMRTIELVRGLAPRVHESFTEIFRLEPGTRIHADPGRYGIEISPTERVFDTSIPFVNKRGLDQREALEIVNRELYPFYEGRDDLIFARRSHNAVRHCEDFARPSIFRATVELEHGAGVFRDSVTVSTNGGGIFRRNGGAARGA